MSHQFMKILNTIELGAGAEFKLRWAALIVITGRNDFLNDSTTDISRINKSF